VRLECYFTKPGTYKVSITTSKKPAPDGPDIMGYYRGIVEMAKRNTDNVWTGTLTSNTVTVKVVRRGRPATPSAEKQGCYKLVTLGHMHAS
jgi:hypothetical protein